MGEVVTVPERDAVDGRRFTWRRLARAFGWLLVTVGGLMALYLVYSLFYTNLITEREQDSLLQEWEVEYGGIDEAAPGASQLTDSTPVEPIEVGDAYAAMWFERPGSDQRPVHAEPLFVVEGVDVEPLKRGPGHYAGTAAPGQPGNFSVAGHRTTYGAPFYHLEELRTGDEVHVVDRDQRKWLYEIVETRVVLPDDVWVVGDDPLGSGAPMLTLTTCEPRFSAAKRLIVFAELRAAS